jgi:Peptidase family M28
MKKIYCILWLALPTFVLAQTNLTITNPVALNVLSGSYTPATYNPSNISQIPQAAILGIKNNISQDSIKNYWLKLGTFYNRSTGNQLASATQGITATFNWVSSKFQEFSAANNNRLIVSDFTFNQSICSASSHKETFAVLPGNSLADKSVIVFLAHADSRAAASCTASSVSAKGMEDNATGVALLMEVARVMSQFSYKQTIVFMITTGEEQGLYGSSAFATYLHNNNISVKAVYNNDIVGSLYCILPTNAVGCSINNGVDSTTVRLFSGGTNNSTSKGWARYVKLEYKENLAGILTVPATINIMTAIDRVSRSGDHVPFYNLGDAAIRMCSFNEPGDGLGSGREHLSLDSGGVDTKPIPNGTIDSFFVSFFFLARNAQIDANAAAMAAVSPATPTYTITNIGNNRLRVVVNSQTGYPVYRLGVRTTSYDFDSVYSFTRLIDTLKMPVSANLAYYVSVASQDTNQVESFFGNEISISGTTGALAIGLVQFNGQLVNDNDVLLSWRVENVHAGDKYEVQRSDDGMQFKTIANIDAAFTYAYNYDDVFPLNGRSYYRLKLNEGPAYSFSPTVTINRGSSITTQLLPIPAVDYITVKTKDVAKPAIITDIQGRKIMTVSLNDGLRIDLRNFLPGVYFLHPSGEGVIKFIKN